MPLRVNFCSYILCALILAVAIPAPAASELTTVVLTGSKAPGLDAVFSQVVFLNSEASINDLGQVAFGGVLAGTEVTGTNDRCVWFFDPQSGVSLIAREGDSLSEGETFRHFSQFALGLVLPFSPLIYILCDVAQSYVNIDNVIDIITH